MDYRKGIALLGTAFIGAGIMYLTDPVSGKRRLSLIRDEFVSGQRKIARTVVGRTEDVKNRLYGLYCEAKLFLGMMVPSARKRSGAPMPPGP